jgi:uncharacterized membrane protein
MTTELFNTLTSGFGAVQGNILSGLGVIVPIALTIFAVLFLWIFAVNFFKRLAGSKQKEEEDDDDDED